MAHHGGIGRYVRSLTQALARACPEIRLRFWLPAAEAAPSWTGGDIKNVRRFDAPIYSLREQWTGSMLCREASRDRECIVHVPHYNAPWMLPPRSVITVHDTIHFSCTEQFPARVRLPARLVLRRAVRRAGAIIAVSEATRQDLLKLEPRAMAKTRVVHHGVGDPFRTLPPDAIAKFRARVGLVRYLLYVGNTKPHKNLHRLLRAFAWVRERAADVALVLLGPGTSALSQAEASVLGIEAVDDADLVYWFGGAQALVLPSMQEGFGLPVLEAMACGTPVVAGGIDSLREVAGDAALFIEPRDESSIGRALLRVLSDAALREDLCRRGAERARGLTWDRTAAATASVYRQVAGTG
jgi:glycosyltransferase involved in cell wall biosynthesis